jgi:hypothetical protein
MLDQEMIERHGTTIAARNVPDALLPAKTGAEVAREVGDRLLLRYLLPEQVGLFQVGSSKLTFVTPTAFRPEDTVSYLALPAAGKPRSYVLLLDPRKIDRMILGPRWIRGGRGIEYLLPDGFPVGALVLPWEIQIV